MTFHLMFLALNEAKPISYQVPTVVTNIHKTVHILNKIGFENCFVLLKI
jgi:hypothetical protein